MTKRNTGQGVVIHAKGVEVCVVVRGENGQILLVGTPGIAVITLDIFQTSVTSNGSESGLWKLVRQSL